MRFLLCVSLIINFQFSIFNLAHAQWNHLQSGDLLFVSDTSGMGQAVKASTGIYTHVALVEREGDSLFVIDATPTAGVARQKFSIFTSHLSPLTFHLYRLTVPFDTAAVIARAKSLIGKPYDNAFLPDNDAYYCSELIQEVFNGTQASRLQNDGTQASRLQFESKPMNWRDKEGNLPEYWIKHFEALGMPIPEGVPGTNPTDLSRSPLLQKIGYGL